MTNRVLNRNIVIRKKLLNFLLNYFSPTNKFVVSISQNLDMLVAKRQKRIYMSHKKRKLTSNSSSKYQRINHLKNIA